MQPSEIAKLCTDSCDQMISYIQARRRTDGAKGRDLTDVDFEIRHGHVIFRAKDPVYNTVGMRLKIGDDIFGEPDVMFDKFDHRTMSMVGYVTPKVMKLLKDVRRRLDGMDEQKRGRDKTVQLMSDLLWLIKSTQDYMLTFGDRLRLPEAGEPFSEEEIPFPTKQVPTDEQKAAVRAVLDKPLSYVWGAPGTGKTQFVLSVAILAEIRRGKRVAVIAPTNNSVEQVLRGVLEMIASEDRYMRMVDLKHDIIRLGLASSEFIRDYPDVCEDHSIKGQISRTESTISVIRKNLFMKRVPELESRLRHVEDYYSGHGCSIEELRRDVARIGEIMRIEPDAQGYGFSVDRDNFRTKIDEVRRFIKGTSRPETEYEEYRQMSAGELEAELDAQRRELVRLEGLTPAARAATARILAMTPHKLMSQFGPEQRETGLKLDVDHIFMDEAAYCNTVHAVPMFTFGVPVTMLGDHMQLQPVCEMEDVDIVNGIVFDDGAKDCFIWHQSALYTEALFTDDWESLALRFTGREGPKFTDTVQCNLTASHRFGENLARILDECVYRNGIHGMPGRSLELICLDVPGPERTDRSNRSEAEAVRRYLDENEGIIGSFAVLTPYSDQVRMLRQVCDRKHKNSILTVHKSQGREWDTVVFSVSDCQDALGDKEFPLHLTSTVDNHGGLYVVNTAVSRAKTRLVLVCDRSFWVPKKGELIGRMAAEAGKGTGSVRNVRIGLPSISRGE